MLRAAATATDAAQAAHRHLTSLQTWQLKQLAVRIGVSAGSNKAETADAILSALSVSKARCRAKTYRSVDMGVKNLAFTTIEEDVCSTSRTSLSTANFTLREWRRMNVLTGMSTTTEPQTEDAEEDGVDGEPFGVGSAAPTTASPNLYSPAKLAPAAARLALHLAQVDNPQLILIERQRFRSGGGSAVQEWTLRVNSLEAMLWASLETMRSCSRRSVTFPATVEMNPARIAAYWNTRTHDSSLEEDHSDDIIPAEGQKPRKSGDKNDPALGAKRGMEKSEKIALVRDWLETGALDVASDLQPLANAFMNVGRVKKSTGDRPIGKKDDLADCVVQGITFGVWERNRRRLRERLDMSNAAS